MKRRVFVLSGFVILLSLMMVFSTSAQDPTPSPTPTITPTLDPDLPANYRVEVVARVSWPIALAWTPDGRLFFTERFTGYLRVINTDGTLQPTPVWQFPVSTEGERGLLGVAVSPDYATTGYIYVYYTRVAGGGYNVPVNRIVRITESGGSGADPVVMLDIPLTTNNLWHQGGNIHFGPDGMLYLTIGEYFEAVWAQSLNVIPGKIHRFEVVGDTLVAPADNPIPGNTIFAYGLRNTFDFDFDYYTETHTQIFATDNGPDCKDELNLILPGGNYGWPMDTVCGGTATQLPAGYVAPLWQITPTEAPTGVSVYTGSQIPQWQGQVFFCMWKTGRMRRAVLDTTRSFLIGVRDVDLRGYTCNIEVETGPDGAIYFTNQDGIYRIVRQ